MQLKLAKNSRTSAIGPKRSPFKGQGLKFKDHQIYSYGDEVRFIDWKVTAKTRIPYIKVFEEEKNQGIDVIIDASSSMSYGCDGLSKFEASIMVLCLFYLWSDLTKDKIRGIILNEGVIDLPRASGKAGIGFLLQSLLKKNMIDEKGNFKVVGNLAINNQKMLENNMHFIMKMREKKNHLVIISDFYNFLNEKSIDYILNSSDAVYLIQILAPLDINANNENPICGFFSNDQQNSRRSLFGFKSELSDFLKKNRNTNTNNNLYQINIGERLFLEKFAKKIR
ncbi:MAG: DUF58 domain-containing protein [Oligoflexia bacterium]|nr:DUF58 domain-containing protein [Oligoflexia bacterium]